MFPNVPGRVGFNNNWWESICIWKKALCPSPHRMDAKKKNRCVIFYVYGWFVGICCGIICTVYTFLMTENLPSRFSLWVAVFTSIAVGLGQILLVSKKSRRYRMWILSRYAICVIGVAIVTCLTTAAAILADNKKGLYFICCTVSAVSYAITCIAFIVKLHDECVRARQSRCRHRRRRRGHREEQIPVPFTIDRFNPELAPGQSYNHDNMVAVFSESDGTIQIVSAPRSVSNPQGGFTIFRSNTNDVITPVTLPILTIPSYNEAVSGQSFPDSPPQYTEHDPGSPIVDTSSSNNDSAFFEQEVTADHQQLSEGSSQRELPPLPESSDRDTPN